MVGSSKHSDLAATPARSGPEQFGQSLRLARKLIAQTLSFFADREQAGLDLLRAYLIELMDARPSAAQAQNLRSIYHLLGRHAAKYHQAVQAALAQELSQALSQALPDPARLKSRPMPIDEGQDGLSLSLIDVADMERILHLDRVAQRFVNRYEAGWLPLSQRLNVLFGKESLSGADNPFHPLIFLQAFVGAWDACGLDSAASMDFAQALLPGSFLDLTPLYDELNATLEKAGVSANRSYVIRLTPGGSVQPGASSAGHSPDAPADQDPASGEPMHEPAGSSSTWSGLEPARRAVVAHARQFLQRLGFQSDHAAAHPPLMGYLGQLQAHAGQSNREPVPLGRDPSQRNVLRQMREHEEVRSAPELDRGTVDALAEVFDFVFADQAIPVQMKVIIGRLQIPVLKAAMMDRDFFLSDQHPARRLVDTLAGASVTWAPEKGEQDPLYVRIETTVQRVLTEFVDDLNVFAELLRDFTEFLFESEQQIQQRVEPAAQSERQVESDEDARAQADEWIHKRLNARPPDAPLVAFLVPFLTQPWRDVIVHTLQTASDPKAASEATLKTMDLLIWSTEPKTSAEQRGDLVAVLPELVRQLNTGLDAIAWDGEDRATFTRRLIHTHTVAIRMKKPPTPDSQAAALESAQGEAALRQLDARRAARQSADIADPFDEQAQALRRGMWFDVVVESGTRARCRLSWVSPLRTRLLFTNRDGFDAFVRSEREVAAMLRLGRLTVLEQAPIVGRALEQLMQGPDANPGPLRLAA